MFDLSHFTDFDPEFALDLAAVTDLVFPDGPHLERTHEPRLHASRVVSGLLTGRKTMPTVATLIVANARLLQTAATRAEFDDLSRETTGELSRTLARRAIEEFWGIEVRQTTDIAIALAGVIAADGAIEPEVAAELLAIENGGPQMIVTLVQMATATSAWLSQQVDEDARSSTVLRQVLEIDEDAAFDAFFAQSPDQLMSGDDTPDDSEVSED
jgi:hypothetical protein